jgi:hypothetical protein
MTHGAQQRTWRWARIASPIEYPCDCRSQCESPAACRALAAKTLSDDDAVIHTHLNYRDARSASSVKATMPRGTLAVAEPADRRPRRRRKPGPHQSERPCPPPPQARRILGLAACLRTPADRDEGMCADCSTERGRTANPVCPAPTHENTVALRCAGAGSGGLPNQTRNQTDESKWLPASARAKNPHHPPPEWSNLPPRSTSRTPCSSRATSPACASAGASPT